MISGITGQDGSYLAELLLFLGYEVHGIVRPASTFNRERIDPISSNPNYAGKFFLHYGDLTDTVSIYKILFDVKPTEIYNLAAQSHVGISFQIPEYSSSVNAQSSIKLFEAVKSFNKDIRIYQACTSEMFGDTPPPQSIQSPFSPQSPYAISKVFTYEMAQYYKKAYNMFISCGILFNHESFRRGNNFVTKKIIKSLVDIKNKKVDFLELGNLDSYRDWGWAPEYVVSIYQMIQRTQPINLVVGTGESASVNDFYRYACSLVDLNPDQILKINSDYVRPLEVDSLKADTSQMVQELGWKPKVNWKDLVEIMMTAELSNFEEQINWPELVTRNI